MKGKIDGKKYGLKYLNYQWRVFNLSAEQLGLPHKRARLWIVGYRQDFFEQIGESQVWSRMDACIQRVVEASRASPPPDAYLSSAARAQGFGLEEGA